MNQVKIIVTHLEILLTVPQGINNDQKKIFKAINKLTCHTYFILYQNMDQNLQFCINQIIGKGYESGQINCYPPNDTMKSSPRHQWNN